MFLLRLAYARRKVLIIIWTSPHPVDKFLLPNKIDWTANGLPVRIIRSIYSKQKGPYDFKKQLLQELSAVAASSDHAANLSREQVVRMQVGSRDLVGCPAPRFGRFCA
jgi:hypothetical protein